MNKIINSFVNLSAGMHFYYVILLSIISLTISYGLGFLSNTVYNILFYTIVFPLNIIIFLGFSFMFYRLLITGDPIDKNKKLTKEDLKYVPLKYKKKILKKYEKNKKNF